MAGISRKDSVQPMQANGLDPIRPTSAAEEASKTYTEGGAGAQRTHLSVQRASRVDGDCGGLDHRSIHIPAERHVAERHVLQRHPRARPNIDARSLVHLEVGDCGACKPRSTDPEPSQLARTMSASTTDRAGKHILACRLRQPCRNTGCLRGASPSHMYTRTMGAVARLSPCMQTRHGELWHPEAGLKSEAGAHR